MLQDTVFSEGEGDAWFERNRQHFEQAEDPVVPFLLSQAIDPHSILEIGSSRGDRLARLHEHYRATVTAVDPAAAAVAEGQKLFPVVQFFVATASHLPLPDESYDLVIANMVFHWIDRKSLLASAAEIDRVIKPEGYLLLGDFAPFTPKKTKYHHCTEHEMYTYKQNYPELFLATAGYALLAQQILHHLSLKPEPATPERERVSLTLLRKVAGGIYDQPEP